MYRVHYTSRSTTVPNVMLNIYNFLPFYCPTVEKCQTEIIDTMSYHYYLLPFNQLFFITKSRKLL